MSFVPFEVFPFDISEGRLIPGREVEALPGDRHMRFSLVKEIAALFAGRAESRRE